MRYAQIVLGPAGSGKSTYCASLQRHAEEVGRVIKVANLDPAAEKFAYECSLDVRDLIGIDDVMEAEDLNYGPNGGLIFCMEYLMKPDGVDWIREELGDAEDDYYLFDCPGQIELYTHMDVMKSFCENLMHWNFRVCAVFILDSHYMVDGSKFLSGSLTALSTMVKMELPQVNVLSKMDLLSKQARDQLEMFLEPEIHELLASEHSISKFNKKFHKLSCSLGKVLDEFSLVRFVPLNLNKEESINDLLIQVDSSIQYGEDLDVKTKDYDFQDPEDDDEKNYYAEAVG